MSVIRLAAFLLLLLPARANAQAAGEECLDTWPKDRDRPQLKEVFPLTGTAGHVVTLTIEVRHLLGEQVFPAGLTMSADSEELKQLKQASFVVPDPKSQVQASLLRKVEGQSALTTVKLPFIALPKEAGRKELTLPRLPVAISRASGQVHTICTDPHVITVEDPLTSVTDPKAHPDPEPRVQIEVWEELRRIVEILLWALPIALLLMWLFFTLRRRFKKTPPPVPPRPPWEIAFAQLRAIEASKLVENNNYEEHLDRVSDTLRQYLGARYGFDGLESTTRELLRQLSSKAPDFQREQLVREILQRADLVKFARRPPSESECLEAFEQTRQLVQETVSSATIATEKPAP
jgi:hypothetical protein